MDLISILLSLVVAALPLAVLSGWLVRSSEGPLGALMHGRDTWWRSTMPWPAGVQEEDDVGWHVGTDANARNGSRARSTDGPPDAGPRVEPIAPRVRVHRQHSGR